MGLLARMFADGVEALDWLGWLSPFGLVALARAEAIRRLDLLLGAPITRLRLLAVEAGTAAAGALTLIHCSGHNTRARPKVDFAVGSPLRSCTRYPVEAA